MPSSNHITILKSCIGKMGGAEKYALRLAAAFRKKGKAVTILTTGIIPSEPGITIKSLREEPIFSFIKVREFDRFCRQQLKRSKAKIVLGLDRNRFQTHLRASNGVHAAYLKRRRQAEGFLKSITFSFNPLHRLLLAIEKESFESPRLQALYTNSLMVREEILEFYKVDESKIKVVHNGVEWHEMESDFKEWPNTKEEMAKTLGLNPSSFHFLFIGNNYKRKGLEPLLEALSKFPHMDFHLSVIGKDKNIPYFKALAEQLHLQKKITFFGPRPDIRSFYALSDALVIPSFYDPFANVTVEALAMGVFVVSSKTNGGSEILSTDSGAVIEDLFDRDAFAVALERAFLSPKTKESSEKIRASVAHLDFSEQLSHFVNHIT